MQVKSDIKQRCLLFGLYTDIFIVDSSGKFYTNAQLMALCLNLYGGTFVSLNMVQVRDVNLELNFIHIQ